MLEGNDGQFYTGMTNNIRRRINEHNGIGYWYSLRSWTTKRRPLFLVHLEKYPNKRDASEREQEIKSMSHDRKARLIDRTSKDQILSAI